MGSDPRLLLFAVIVLLAFTTEAAIGFGSTLITVALAVRLYPIHQLLPMIVPLNLVLQLYMVTRHRHHIARDLILRRILPWMSVGVALGLAVFQSASSDILQRLFGVFVLIVAAREALKVARPGAGSTAALSSRWRAAGLLGAGVAHGMFASGGPLLVWVLGRSGLNKRAFRSTLAAVWSVFNVVLIAVFAFSGRLDAGVIRTLGVPVLAVLASIAAGEWIHQRLNEQRFLLAVSLLLIVAALSLVV
jgi:uncharacterized membrane protein YfcA